MRRRVPLAAVAMCALAGGCGGDGPAPPPVRLAIAAPSDRAVVRAATVELRGTVRPASAVVTVRGEACGGLRRGRVPGDRDARARHERHRRARERRRARGPPSPRSGCGGVVAVRVPDVVGVLAADVARPAHRRRAQGRTSTTRTGSSSASCPATRVCETDPSAGDEVDPGTTVARARLAPVLTLSPRGSVAIRSMRGLPSRRTTPRTTRPVIGGAPAARHRVARLGAADAPAG